MHRIAEALTPIVLWMTTATLVVHETGAVWVAMSAGSAGLVSGMYLAKWFHQRAQAEHDEQLLNQIINELETR